MKGTDVPRPARLTLKTLGILAGLGLLSLGGYLAISGAVLRVGFPLDDAWIHQTYARNLAQLGEWAFIPGKPSGGSTSPLWTVLLGVGYLLRLSPYVWTYLLGWAALTGIGILAEMSMRKLVPAYEPGFPWVGAGFVLEWHLVWASGSGMETLPYALVIAVVLFGLLSGERKWGVYGLLAGGAVWIRPDGVSLLGPVFLAIVWVISDWRGRLRAGSRILGGFLVGFLPYLIFNQATAGSWWPNTFYAKQAEYLSLQQIPILTRLASELSLPLIGVGALLLPGALLFVWKHFRAGGGRIIPVVLWLIGYIGLYAWRLPVTYQHGRYIMPAMPVYFMLGAAGLVEFLTQASNRRMDWILSRTWGITLVCLLAAFYAMGARAYATDVSTIETEMVDTARWLAANSAPHSIIAAHDIGALGYFGGRDVIDLAGLISPDVIPFMRNEDRLALYLKQKQVTYLEVFPDWYAHLTDGLKTVYESPGKFAPEQGQPNMRVYQWRP
jgi:hypothetical protein